MWNKRKRHSDYRPRGDRRNRPSWAEMSPMPLQKEEATNFLESDKMTFILNDEPIIGVAIRPSHSSNILQSTSLSSGQIQPNLSSSNNNNRSKYQSTSFSSEKPDLLKSSVLNSSRATFFRTEPNLSSSNITRSSQSASFSTDLSYLPTLNLSSSNSIHSTAFSTDQLNTYSSGPFKSLNTVSTAQPRSFSNVSFMSTAQTQQTSFMTDQPHPSSIRATQSTTFNTEQPYLSNRLIHNISRTGTSQSTSFSADLPYTYGRGPLKSFNTVSTARPTSFSNVSTTQNQPAFSNVSTTRTPPTVSSVSTTQTQPTFSNVSITRTPQTVSNVSTTQTQPTFSNVSTKRTPQTVSNVSTTQTQPTFSNVSTKQTQPTLSNVSTTRTPQTVSNVSTTQTQPTFSNVSTKQTQPTLSNACTTRTPQTVSDVSTTQTQPTFSNVSTTRTQPTLSNVNQFNQQPKLFIDSQLSTEESRTSAFRNLYVTVSKTLPVNRNSIVKKVSHIPNFDSIPQHTDKKTGAGSSQVINNEIKSAANQSVSKQIQPLVMNQEPLMISDRLKLTLQEFAAQKIRIPKKSSDPELKRTTSGEPDESNVPLKKRLELRKHRSSQRGDREGGLRSKTEQTNIPTIFRSNEQPSQNKTDKLRKDVGTPTPSNETVKGSVSSTSVGKGPNLAPSKEFVPQHQQQIAPNQPSNNLKQQYLKKQSHPPSSSRSERSPLKKKKKKAYMSSSSSVSNLKAEKTQGGLPKEVLNVKYESSRKIIKPEKRFAPTKRKGSGELFCGFPNIKPREIYDKLLKCPCGTTHETPQITNHCVHRLGLDVCYLCLAVTHGDTKSIHKHNVRAGHFVNEKKHYVRCPFQDCGKLLNFRRGIKNHLTRLHFPRVDTKVLIHDLYENIRAQVSAAASKLRDESSEEESDAPDTAFSESDTTDSSLDDDSDFDFDTTLVSAPPVRAAATKAFSRIKRQNKIMRRPEKPDKYSNKKERKSFESERRSFISPVRAAATKAFSRIKSQNIIMRRPEKSDKYSNKKERKSFQSERRSFISDQSPVRRRNRKSKEILKPRASTSSLNVEKSTFDLSQKSQPVKILWGKSNSKTGHQTKEKRTARDVEIDMKALFGNDSSDEEDEPLTTRKVQVKTKAPDVPEIESDSSRNRNIARPGSSNALVTVSASVPERPQRPQMIPVPLMFLIQTVPMCLGEGGEILACDDPRVLGITNVSTPD